MFSTIGAFIGDFVAKHVSAGFLRWLHARSAKQRRLFWIGLCLVGITTAVFSIPGTRLWIACAGRQWVHDRPGDQVGAIAERIELRDGLTADVVNAWKLIPKPPMNAGWQIGQVAMALCGERDRTTGLEWVNPDELRARLDSLRGPGDRYWREVVSEKQVPHLGATGWALLAMHRYGDPRCDEDLKSILGMRCDNLGCWPLYKATYTDETRRVILGSAYSTCMLALALDEAVRSPSTSVERRKEAREALSRSIMWLKSIKAPAGKARWAWSSRIPPMPYSHAMSGLVLHTLFAVADENQLAASERARIADEWLSQLPEVPDVMASDVSQEWLVFDDGNAIIDYTRNYQWPWLIIATVDAMEEASALGRINGATWIHKAISRNSDLARRVANEPYLAAECLLALKYLDGESDGLRRPKRNSLKKGIR